MKLRIGTIGLAICLAASGAVIGVTGCAGNRYERSQSSSFTSGQRPGTLTMKTMRSICINPEPIQKMSAPRASTMAVQTIPSVGCFMMPGNFVRGQRSNAITKNIALRRSRAASKASNR